MASQQVLDAATLVELPWDVLPASAAVDFLQVVACGKQAVRLKLPKFAHERVAAWGGRIGWATFSDHHGYICLARTFTQAEQILTLDGSATTHTAELGVMLSYPECCSERIASIGEDRIDFLADKAGDWRLEGAFRLTRITGYLQGRALISHVPCSPRCPVSLQLAACAAAWLRAAEHHRWLSEPRLFLEEASFGQ